MSRAHEYARAVIAQTIAELIDANQKAWEKGQVAHQAIGGVGLYAEEDIAALKEECAVVRALLQARNKMTRRLP